MFTLFRNDDAIEVHERVDRAKAGASRDSRVTHRATNYRIVDQTGRVVCETTKIPGQRITWETPAASRSTP